MATVEKIEKIFIDSKGLLCVKPEKQSFDLIYRSAMGVHWECEGNYLVHSISTEWSTAQWYKQILDAVKAEYGVMLLATDKTLYENVDEEMIISIKNVNGACR